MRRSFVLPDLLVSGLFIGGLALVHDGEVNVIDHESSSGLWVAGDWLYRAFTDLKRAEIRVYHRFILRRRIELPECADLHDVRLVDGLLTAVSTGTNEIVQLDEATGLLTRYQPPGDGDAWHLNSVCAYRGDLICSAFGDFPSHRSWKDQTKGRGCIVSVSTGEILYDSLSMPHCLQGFDDDLYLCNSEEHEFLRITSTGERSGWQLEGYPRGLAVNDEYIFVGESSGRHLMSERRTPESHLGRISVFDRRTMERVTEIPLPFSEVYDLRLVDSSWYDQLTSLIS